MALKFGITAVNQGDSKTLPEISSVEVREELGETITYTVTLTEDICDGDFPLLKDTSFDPGCELSIWVEIDSKKVYLVTGPVKSQDVKINNGGQGSEVQITGTDNTHKMKMKEQLKNHENVTDKSIITDTLNFYNLTPAVGEIDLRNDSEKHSKIQNRDDHSFIKGMAAENGCYFWLTYDDKGKETAHVKHLPLKDKPVARLILNGDDDNLNNIDELSISWDADVPTSVVGHHLDASAKKKLSSKVEKAPQHKLGKHSLADIATKYKQEARNGHRPVDDEGRAQKRSEGALNEAEWFIRASCSTTFDRICTVIHAHTIVEIVGAGTRHSGYYLVSGVTHTIDVASYKMQLELKRNAWEMVPATTATGTGS